jgi:hypothetical protein
MKRCAMVPNLHTTNILKWGKTNEYTILNCDESAQMVHVVS